MPRLRTSRLAARSWRRHGLAWLLGFAALLTQALAPTLLRLDGARAPTAADADPWLHALCSQLALPAADDPSGLAAPAGATVSGPTDGATDGPAAPLHDTAPPHCPWCLLASSPPLPAADPVGLLSMPSRQAVPRPAQARTDRGSVWAATLARGPPTPVAWRPSAPT